MAERECQSERTVKAKAGPLGRKIAAAFAVGLTMTVLSGFFAARASRCGIEPTAAERINPNTAAVASLMRLPGIGRTRAMDIAAGRSSEPFTCAADLERIRGIGPKTVAKMEPYLTFEAGHQKNETTELTD